MSKSPRRDLQVFDFNEEDEVASDKHHNFLARDSEVNKVGIKSVASIHCVDVAGAMFNLEKDCSDPSPDTVEDIYDSKENSSVLEADKESNLISHESRHHFKIDIHNHNKLEKMDTSGEVSSPETSQVDPSGSSFFCTAPSGSSYSNESIDVNSEADDSMDESAPTSPASDFPENGVSLNGCGLNGTDNSDMDDTNTEVVLHPDYVIYQDNYYLGPKLTFSPCFVKINVSTTCIKQEAFDLEWTVDDLIDINCQLFQSSGTVVIKLRVISSNASQSKHVSDASGIEELEIAVADYNWSLRHRQITSLNLKYLASWNMALRADVEGNKTDSRGSRCYFPNFEEPFDDVIYPKGDPDAVSLSKRDVDLLQPDTFINDTIIDFYIQYLKNQIPDMEKHRFHFFNSFFFRKLADMDKNPSSASDGKAAFLRVRKWTRKVNLFAKDYIFIPVNFNLHWSLIVICHPGEVVNFNDKEPDNSLKVPCILHMDSIKGSHSGLKNLVQSYLWEEWKERHKDTLEEDLSSRFLNMRFLPLALPQQENSYDCGLFLLHYLELFLVEAPLNFNPFKLTKFSNFLNVDWFLPAEAFLKRTLIQKLIFELVENHGSHEISSSDCSGDDECLENNDNRTGIDHPEVNKEPTTSHAGQGIEITLLSGSSSLDPQSFNNSGLVLKELFDPGATAGAMLGQCQSFDQRSSDYRSIFSMEEDTDLGDQFMYLATDPNYQQVAGITPQTCSLPYLPRDCGDEKCHRPQISLLVDRDVVQPSLDASNSVLDDSEDITVCKNCLVVNEPGSSNEPEQGEKTCSAMEKAEHVIDISNSVVGNSLDSITKCDDNKNGDLHSSGQETTTISVQQFPDALDDEEAPTIPLQQVSDAVDDEEAPTTPLKQVSDAVDDEAGCDDGQMIDSMEPDNCEEQAAKRRRLMPLRCRSGGIGTESDL
ncbi:putative ubiquitin-like-specific protease 2B isoform A [Glycine soja]|uniref:Putative ubiquitin-like-specific protease 2B isoform A n=1 Tax=Glycine soja TaxID=3848 RepID=A0A445KXY9_GLYSO|nr:putative ubiquitin-like-specific protease 2B isoform A [Glycine soja]